jgi:hypothetical protein
MTQFLRTAASRTGSRGRYLSRRAGVALYVVVSLLLGMYGLITMMFLCRGGCNFEGILGG